MDREPSLSCLCYTVYQKDSKHTQAMSTSDTFAIIALAALIHASFQLSVSMMTVMSGHALGKRTGHNRVMRLILGFILGVMTMVALGVSFLALLTSNLAPDGWPTLAWAGVSGLMIGVGVAVWVVYYRYRKPGTVLWLPRGFADYLSSRARAAKLAPEAFGLGLASVVSEFIFGLAPMLVTALLLAPLDAPLQLAGLALYTIIVSLPLHVIAVLVGGGRSLARVQRWREQHKRFIQFTAGSALIVLGAYLYVDIVMTQILIGGAGV